MKFNDMTWGQMEAVVNKIGGMNGVTRLLANELMVVEVASKPIPSILEFLGIILFPGTTTKFVASEKFKPKSDGGICSHISPNFTNWLLPKTEEPVPATTLRHHKLRKNATDMPQKPGQSAIIPELGGEVETTLSEVFSFLEKQSKGSKGVGIGESGVLLTTGYANIFYVKDKDGVLRAVCVSWGDAGWYVFAHEVSHPSAWYDGSQVFSRNSVLESSEPLAA